MQAMLRVPRCWWCARARYDRAVPAVERRLTGFYGLEVSWEWASPSLDFSMAHVVYSHTDIHGSARLAWRLDHRRLQSQSWRTGRRRISRAT